MPLAIIERETDKLINSSATAGNSYSAHTHAHAHIHVAMLAQSSLRFRLIRTFLSGQSGAGSSNRELHEINVCYYLDLSLTKLYQV